MSGITGHVRETVLQRDGMKCVSCGRFVDRSNYSIHHRMPRGMGGSKNPALNLPANLLTLCGSGTTGCHGWVESHRERSYEWGYLIRRGTAVTTFVPVFTASGWMRFDNDGGVAEAYPVNHTREMRRRLDGDIERARLERIGEAA